MAADPIADINRLVQSAVVNADGCWIWQKSKSRDGYGMAGIGSRKIGTFRVAYVHRWLYEQMIGEVPENLELDHKCRTRGCVNPDHLEPVTHKENVNRGVSANRERTHCVVGHPLSGENLYVTPTGKRMCKQCRRRRSRERGKRTNWADQKRFRDKRSA